MLFQFKIQLKGITKPPVWRRVLVPSNFTFERFHDVIQTVFQWEDCHLYLFSPKGFGSNPLISIPDDDWPVDYDAGKTKLQDIFNAEGQTYTYVYDFGDSWEHLITLETISPELALKAVCLAGKGACPPEDIGGFMMFQHMKDILANKPNSEDAKFFRDQYALLKGETWDEVYEFLIEEINEDLLEV